MAQVKVGFFGSKTIDPYQLIIGKMKPLQILTSAELKITDALDIIDKLPVNPQTYAIKSSLNQALSNIIILQND